MVLQFSDFINRAYLVSEREQEPNGINLKNRVDCS